MKLRVKAYAPNGASLGVLPAPAKVNAAMVLGDTGGLSLEYGKTAPQVAILNAPCELALEISADGGLNWSEPDDCRYVYLRRKGDSVKRPSRITAEAAAYSWRLQTAKVLPSGLLNADGKRAFLTATAGTIMRTLIQEAQTRGALTGITFDFTTTLDSAGVAWAKTVTLYYEPGKDYLAIIRNLFDQGLVDFRFRGRTLQMFNADTAMGRRLDAANPVVDLRYGRDLTEAPWTGTWEALANFAYVDGDNGVSLERLNGAATAPWGRQETYITQGGVSDLGTMTTLADAALEGTAAERIERTFGLTLVAPRWLPVQNYALGDFVAVGDPDNALGALVAYRVRQITLTRDEQGVVGGNVVLNDRFVEQEIRTTRRVSGITGGSTIAGGSGATPVPLTPGIDTTIPAAVTGLATASVAYLDDQGLPHAQVTLTWSAVTLNTNATACDDLARYEVYTWATAFPADVIVYPADISASGGIVRWSNSPYPAGFAQSFKIRAVDTSGHAGAFSGTVNVTTAADATPPVTPSTPTTSVRLGVVTVTWDGKDNAAHAMTLDTSRVDVHRSVTSGFTPDPTTLVGSMAGPDILLIGDQAYNTTWYYRLVAYDTSGNASTPSAQGSAVTTPLVSTDLVGTPISGGALVAGSVTAAQIDAATNTAISTAQSTATTAQTTANGKNKVTYSTLAASGTAYVDGDVWFQTSAGVIIGQWAFLTGAWAARTIDSAVIANLDAGKITAGTLSAARIAVGSLTGDKLVSSSVTALQIAANTITAGQIAAGTITAGLIAADAITGTKIQAGALDGKTITGALIRTAASGQRWELTSANVSTLLAYSGLAEETAPAGIRIQGTPGGGTSGYSNVGFTSGNFGNTPGGITIETFQTDAGGAAPYTHVNITGDQGDVGQMYWDATSASFRQVVNVPGLTSTGNVTAPNLKPTATGSVALASLAATTGAASGTQSFPAAFATIPKVTASTTSSRISIGIDSVTTLGFHFSVNNFTPALSGAATLSWIAVM